MDNSQTNYKNDFNLDDYLNEIGGLKKYQLINFGYVGLAMLIVSAVSLTFVFTAGDLNYRCVVPKCDNNSNISEIYNPDWLQYAVPYHDGLPDKCQRYKFVNETEFRDNQVCDANSFDTEVVERCTEFIYETDEKTIVNEWNITCPENKWKLRLVGTIEKAGTFIGIPLAGYVSDMYGRKFSFITALIALSTIGLLRSFSWNYISFVAFGFLDPIVGAGIYPSLYILSIELVGPKYRVLFGSVINVCYALGEMILGVVAMLVPDWRWILRILFIPGYLVIFYIWLVPESVRWLLIKGRNEKAVKLLKHAAFVNNAVLSPETTKVLEDLEGNLSNVSSNTEQTVTGSKKYEILDIFKYPSILIRIANCSYSWFSITFVYYGLSLISVSINGDKYANYILVCAIEIPASILSWWVNEKYGRKKSLSGSMIICGLACIGSVFVKTSQIANLTLFLIGKFAITLAFGTIYTYTTEMFPTNLRQSLLSICSTIGRFGNVLATQASLLTVLSPDLPMYCFGCVVILSGLLGLYFPETLNKRLPDTLENAIDLNSKDPKKI